MNCLIEKLQPWSFSTLFYFGIKPVWRILSVCCLQNLDDLHHLLPSSTMPEQNLHVAVSITTSSQSSMLQAWRTPRPVARPRLSTPNQVCKRFAICHPLPTSTFRTSMLWIIMEPKVCFLLSSRLGLYMLPHVHRIRTHSQKRNGFAMICTTFEVKQIDQAGQI